MTLDFVTSCGYPACGMLTTLAPNQFQALAFGLRHCKELLDGYQRRGCAHV